MSRPMPNHLTTTVLLALTTSFFGACRDAPDEAATGSYSQAAASQTPANHAAPTRRGALRGHVHADGIDTTGYSCVFVIGRRAADAAFPDLVSRLPAGPFPMPFELTARDLMGVGSLRGTWFLTVRLDRDGDAPAGKGDWQGLAEVTVDENGGMVAVHLDSEVTEDAPPMMSLDGSSMPAGASGHGGAQLGSATPGQGPLPSGHPSVAPVDPHAGHNHAAGEHDDGSGATADAGGPALQLVIDIAPELAAQAQSGVLFVFVRNSETGRGMPLAVKSVQAPSFPTTITLTTADMPMQFDNKLELMSGTLYATAILDLDGNVGSKDGLTSAPTAVTSGAAPVDVVISSRRTP